jgi:hypothetical protein
LLGCVLRDAELHPLVREVSDLRYGPSFALIHQVLGAGLKDNQRALLTLALSFHTWATLTRDAKLKPAQAVAAMTNAILARAAAPKG